MAVFRLPRLIGLGPARRLILSGESVTAEEAYRLGLVDHVVPAERWREGLAEIVGLYLRAPRSATIAAKRLMLRAFDADAETVYQESLPLIRECLASPEVEAAKVAWRQRKEARKAGDGATA
jgi:enoyl-CoA hydratase/carnithine racemase